VSTSLGSGTERDLAEVPVAYTPALRLTHEAHATLIRLEQFQRAHPGIEIQSGLRFWQAIVPEDSGSTIITRYTLTVLLDRLAAVMNGETDG
jgi:hypothetical protein